MAYQSSKVAVTAEATASDAEILAVGGLRTLTIRNHLIQTTAKAQAVADAYLLEYKAQKKKIKILTPVPLPYEVGDTIGIEV